MLKTIYILLFIYNIGVFGQQKWVLDLCKNRESHWVSQTKCRIEGYLNFGKYLKIFMTGAWKPQLHLFWPISFTQVRREGKC